MVFKMMLVIDGAANIVKDTSVRVGNVGGNVGVEGETPVAIDKIQSGVGPCGEGLWGLNFRCSGKGLWERAFRG